MATNRGVELILEAMYPNSMQHIQQLIMDAEVCAKAYRKRSLFGRDKFEPAVHQFMATLARCVVALAVDGHVNDLDDTESGVDALNEALLMFEDAYGNWPIAFMFWRDYYVQVKSKAARDS